MKADVSERRQWFAAHRRARSGPLKILIFLLIGALCAALANGAESTLASKDLTFKDILATRQGDSRSYVLVGSGWIRGIRFGDSGKYVSKWLAEHPKATVTPISQMLMTNTRTKKGEELVYIWLDDGDASLNVDLVRAGMFPGAAMADMVDNDKGLTELLKNPQLADAKAQIEKERAEMPQDRPERLVSEEEYKMRMDRVQAAEAKARQERLGIWSEEMKAERESDGLP
jgi:endonuclease YncB( thermonuclease family)